MIILFLDLDGVLNSIESLKQSNKATPTDSEMNSLIELKSTFYSGYPLSVLTTDLLGLDQDCIKHLNLILEATGAQVVVSSSWRYSHNILGLQKLLEHRGFKGKLIDSTPVNIMGKEKSRGQEIKSWLDLNPEVERFVILDDNRGMAPLTKYLVQTNSKVGLTKEDAKKAILLLKSDTVWV